jgi:hypothetical protein
MKAEDKKQIKEIFEQIYFLENESDTKIDSIQVKATKRLWMFDRYSPYPQTLSWKEAENEFLSKLTAEQKSQIKITYGSEEYADLEEHDKETDCITISVIFEK